MNLREQHLIQLGFERKDISAEESGDTPFHFYVMDLSETNPNFCLISCSNDEAENGEWWVDFLETEIRFHHYEHLHNMIFQFQGLKRFTENEKKYSPNKK
jgi:hypothetical protein